MKTRIETIDAEKANYYLSLNRKNRPITVNKVAQYLSEMENGKWKENTGEAIKISKEGFLIDGQHRLLAISKSSRSINFLVVYDLDSNVFDVLDTGKNRGASDVFALNNIPNYSRTAAIIREYLSFKDGRFYKTVSKDSSKFTNSALLSAYEERNVYYDKVSNRSSVLYHSFNKILSSTNIGSFYLLFSESNQTRCDDFFNQLCGNDLITNKSILILKNFLIKDKLSIKKAPTKLRYAYIIKTWNSFILEKEIKVLKYDVNVELFPKII